MTGAAAWLIARLVPARSRFVKWQSAAFQAISRMARTKRASAIARKRRRGIHDRQVKTSL
ncbi:hypothetical protein I603_2285 [Erythrobacter dokdonensis DSW-74]|uniref:Uncharacterized protein n=1 Tax=Erythrobacter dokdonensis DSW-74 TaxID=1300349 RepID=A0A1A7BCS6_9SPHN|nr:hypothetical protein I603_2285 [Erythrobacter dokdonensis DSW-74]